MYKHCHSKTFIQLPRNEEDHAIAYFTLYFAYFFTLQSILYKESPQNWRVLSCGQTIEEKHKIPPPPPMDYRIMINIIWPFQVRSLYSEQVETDLCATCHAFTLHVRALKKLKRLCVLIKIFLCFCLLGRFWTRIVL